MRFGKLATGAVGLALAASLTACSNTGSSSSSSDPILIGASIPLSGTLAGFGTFEKWGYQHAVDLANAKGGITVDGVKRKVKLVLLDDTTNPSVSANNVKQLIDKDRVSALLGSCTDTLVVPGALIADRAGVPMVTPCETTDGFSSTKSWKSVWDIFFSTQDFTESPFKMLSSQNLPTNHKIAIIHVDGRAETMEGTQEWPGWAKKYGYTVTYNASFDMSTTSFTSDLQAAKASGADILLALGQPPAMISMRKEMATIGYNPKVLVMDEGGEPMAFANALGKLSNGIYNGGYWDPSLPFTGASQLAKDFESQTHSTYSQHIGDTEAAAAVLIDAISRAGSVDSSKVNAALAKTNLSTVVGQVQFNSQHYFKLPMVEMQWQNGHSYVVSPTDKANAKIIFPLPSAS